MPGSEVRLRVATFNLHGGRSAAGRLDFVAVEELVRRLDADLTGLQEVHRYLPPPGSFQDQPGRLRRGLGQELWFSPALGWGPIGYGNALLSRLPVRDVRSHILPGKGERRVLMEAEVEVGSRRALVLNTHLGLSPEARLAQMERLERLVRAAEEVDRPVIALGDWNGTPDSPELRLLASAGLVHAVAPWVPTFPSDGPLLRLDYVMVSEHFRIIEGEALASRISDHLALYADLVLED